MTNKKPEKPVTLADYIPPEPDPETHRRAPSKLDRERLNQLERDMAADSDEKEGQRQRRKSKKGGWLKVFVWIAVILFFANIFGD